MDGDFDFSQLSREQLEQELSRLDKAKYPLNHQRLLLELETRTDGTEVKAPPSFVALIARYSFFLAVAYLSLLVLAIFGLARSPVLLMAVATVPTFLVFLHLARHHQSDYSWAAVGIAAVGSMLSAGISAIDLSSKPITVLLATAVLNCAMASLAGTLNAMRHLEPPSNNRWRGP